jgi:hypothetical protein
MSKVMDAHILRQHLRRKHNWNSEKLKVRVARSELWSGHPIKVYVLDPEIYEEVRRVLGSSGVSIEEMT